MNTEEIINKLNSLLGKGNGEHDVSPTSYFGVNNGESVVHVNFLKLSKDVLYKKYIVDNMYVTDIAKEFNCNRRTIHRYLRNFNICRKGRSIALKGKPSNFKNHRFTSESLKKKSIATIRALSEGKMPTKETGIERLIENQLLFRGFYNYVKQYSYELGVADFWLPEINIIIECDGDYWHSKLGAKEKDNKQTQWLEYNDYIVYRFLGSEINNDASYCINLIAELQ